MCCCVFATVPGDGEKPTESLFAAFTVEETEFVALKMVKIQCDKYATD